MLVVLAIAALAILACVVVVSLGRGGELTEFPPDVPPLDLPEAGQLTAVDFMALQLPVNLVGYHTQSVDETLRRAANAISARDTRIAVLEQRVSELLASRLQARQEVYAGPSAAPRTEHRPDAPALALSEDGSPSSDARVGHHSTADLPEVAPPADGDAVFGQRGDDTPVPADLASGTAADHLSDGSAMPPVAGEIYGSASSSTAGQIWGGIADRGEVEDLPDLGSGRADHSLGESVDEGNVAASGHGEGGHLDSDGAVEPQMTAEAADAEAHLHDAGTDGDAPHSDARQSADRDAGLPDSEDAEESAFDRDARLSEPEDAESAPGRGTGLPASERGSAAEGSNGADELPASIGRRGDGRS
ncbi:hypothetical protein GCM10010404_24950 [Nonomuraea africana]|uniref:DivIVA domain-containing protein n=1 Tax=Nonomuraea africana TaxID=46171 RepID=A0ABR9KMR9_9ACTN|nr:hypothetical protein [Nonomuraea africana]MBE1563317.1 hypothetical protein [Nonomuraea africana]